MSAVDSLPESQKAAEAASALAMLREARARLANAARSVQKIPPIAPDRRRHRRVSVRLFGRFMLEDKQEYPCQVIDISAGGVALIAPVPCEVGQHVVAYLDNIGRVEGEIVRLIEGGFAMRISATLRKREKIVNLLTWLINQKSLGLAEDRRHERITPTNAVARLMLPDGTAVECRVLDISLSGASVALADRPDMGTFVTLGRMQGEVVRHHEQGIGIRFTDVQDQAALARHFGL